LTSKEEHFTELLRDVKRRQKVHHRFVGKEPKSLKNAEKLPGGRGEHCSNFFSDVFGSSSVSRQDLHERNSVNRLGAENAERVENALLKLDEISENDHFLAKKRTGEILGSNNVGLSW